MTARVLAGDDAAFAALVRRHAGTATRMAVLWGAGADAEDVVQDAFVKAYLALPRFRRDSSFRAWLLTIVRNETRNLLRSRGRRAAREGLVAFPEEAWGGPEEEVMTAERRRVLLASLRAMASPLREAVACRYLLELSEAETARVLGVPAGTVKSRLHRALAALRREVDDG